MLQAKHDQRATYYRSARTSTCAPNAAASSFRSRICCKLEDMAGQRSSIATIGMRARDDHREPRAGLHARRRARLSREPRRATELPSTAQIDYKGESLEYKEASGALYFTFGIALFVVFLVLAAQFESFVHPLVIMVTVPLAVAGGLLGLLGHRPDAQHLQPDRHRHAGRHRGEERRPDRRVHQPIARSGHRVSRGDRRSGAYPLPADAHDDVLRRRWAPCR